MTPPTAIGHAASTHGFPVTTRPASDAELARSFGRAVAPRTWQRLRLLVDVVVLYLAAGAALLAEPGSAAASSQLLAAIFPIVCLAVLYGRRRAADDRLQRNPFDSAVNAVTVIAIGTVVTIAVATVIGAPHTVELPLRLALFGAVYLLVARVMMLMFRRQALRNPELATPTLIVGAGAVGEHLVKRLEDDTRYGLRPVGFLDSNPPTRSDLSSAPLIPLLGAPEELAEAIERTDARHVIVAFSSEPDSELLRGGRAVSGPWRRGLAGPPHVRGGQRARHARPRRRPAGANAEADQPAQLAVRGQARDRPGARAGRADRRRAGDGRDRVRGQADLARTDHVPPAPRRARRSQLSTS